MVAWEDVTAVFGGSFDPPHFGHVQVVQDLLTHVGVKRVLLVPSGRPSYKMPLASASHRLEMLKLSFMNPSQYQFSGPVMIDQRELERAEQFPDQFTTSFETIMELKSRFSPLAFTVGIDQLVQLRSWFRFPEIITLCHWIVLVRKPMGMEIAERTLDEWRSGGLISFKEKVVWRINQTPYELRFFHTRAPSVSSSEIRESIGRNGIPPTHSLTEEVWNYLKRNHLYGSGVQNYGQ